MCVHSHRHTYMLAHTQSRITTKGEAMILSRSKGEYMGWVW